MRHVFPPADGPLDPSWTAPLEIVAEAIRARWRYRFFDLDDFMIMCRLRRGRRRDLLLYKHVYTRRYLNLDDSGAAYRFVPTPRGPGIGRYLPQRDLDRALDQLGLWELPWMKPALEAHRRGVPWEERWLLYPHEDDLVRPHADDLDDPLLPEVEPVPERRRHLRLL
jgi:hypothetical protein